MDIVNQMIIVESPTGTMLTRPFLSKGQYVYHLLKDKIVNGYLERSRIYTIIEIAESLGVSRTPVSEAVKILGAQYYIILYPGVGFKIRELSAEDIHENLAISGALEKAVLEKIIRDGTTPTERMQEAVDRSRQALENQAPELYTHNSADFHRAFYALADFPKVTEILYENVFVHEIWYREGVCQYPELIKRLIDDHENIIRIIQHQYFERISEVINAHIENCEDVLIKVVQAEGAVLDETISG